MLFCFLVVVIWGEALIFFTFEDFYLEIENGIYCRVIVVVRNFVGKVFGIC